MTVKGHILLSFPLATIINSLVEEYYFSIRLTDAQLLLFYIGLFIGTIFPDIDEPESYIGRKLPIFSNILAIFIEHRGITHLLIIPLLLLIFNYYLVEDIYTKIVIYAFAIGIFCHDCGDLFTKGGIRGFFYPLLPTTTIGLLPRQLRFRTGSVVEYFFIILLLVTNILFFLPNIKI
jgi:inner membrane protein